MQDELKCANCGIDIRWQPTMVDGKIYCCAGCAAGGPCVCDYDNLPQEESGGPIVAWHSARPTVSRGNGSGSRSGHNGR